MLFDFSAVLGLYIDFTLEFRIPTPPNPARQARVVAPALPMQRVRTPSPAAAGQDLVVTCLWLLRRSSSRNQHLQWQQVQSAAVVVVFEMASIVVEVVVGFAVVVLVLVRVMVVLVPAMVVVVLVVVAAVAVVVTAATELPGRNELSCDRKLYVHEYEDSGFGLGGVSSKIRLSRLLGW